MEDIIRSPLGGWGLVPRKKMASGDWSPEQKWILGTRFFSYYFLFHYYSHMVPSGPICGPQRLFWALGTRFFFFANFTSGPQRQTYPLGSGPQKLFWALGTRFFFFC